MELLQLREKEIFNTLKNLDTELFVIIGGYAVNSYTLPRFSVDCDIVVSDKDVLKNIKKKLLQAGYKKTELPESFSYHGEFFRFEKIIKKNFRVSMDILFQKVTDRQTRAVFTADWIFNHSTIQRLKGKTINETLNARIIDVDALFTMKLISCRPTDIRDLFMMMPYVKDQNWIKEQVSKRYDFRERYLRFKKKITSSSFRNGLQGVYGYVNPDVFEKHKNLILAMDSKA